MSEDNAWIKDLIAAQKEMPKVEKDGKNPHFKNDYAKYDTAIEAIKKVYNKHNFFVNHQVTGQSWYDPELKKAIESTPVLVTELLHVSGKKLSSSMPLLNKAGTDQGMGSSITYAKRYTLLALVAVSSGDEDDDGDAANPKQHPQSAKQIFQDVRNNKAEVPMMDEYEPFPNFDELPKSPTLVKTATAEHLVFSGDTEMEGGKNKGKTFRELCEHHLDYVKWAADQPTLKGQLADLVAYARYTGAVK